MLVITKKTKENSDELTRRAVKGTAKDRRDAAEKIQTKGGTKSDDSFPRKGRRLTADNS